MRVAECTPSTLALELLGRLRALFCQETLDWPHGLMVSVLHLAACGLVHPKNLKP